MRKSFWVTGSATGDQVLFISKTLFEKVGGYAEITINGKCGTLKTLAENPLAGVRHGCGKNLQQALGEKRYCGTVCLM